MKKIAIVSSFSILLIAALVAIAGFGQSSHQDSKKHNELSAELQWEYLVVAGGNVNLSTSGNEQYGSMRKQPDGSFGREAFALERNLDKAPTQTDLFENIPDHENIRGSESYQ